MRPRRSDRPSFPRCQSSAVSWRQDCACAENGIRMAASDAATIRRADATFRRTIIDICGSPASYRSDNPRGRYQSVHQVAAVWIRNNSLFRSWRPATPAAPCRSLRSAGGRFGLRRLRQFAMKVAGDRLRPVASRLRFSFDGRRAHEFNCVVACFDRAALDQSRQGVPACRAAPSGQTAQFFV